MICGEVKQKRLSFVFYENDLHIPEDPKSYFSNDLINIRLEKINNNLKTIEHLDQPLIVQDAAHLFRSTGFGRGAYENKLEGTEHGTAVPHFLIGGKINGGFYGEQPSLSQLKDGDMEFITDNRYIYNKVLESWVSISDSKFSSSKIPGLQKILV